MSGCVRAPAVRVVSSFLLQGKLRFGFAVLLAYPAVGTLRAQPIGGVYSTIRGEVEAKGHLPAHLQIEVRGERGVRKVIAPVFSDGGFELGGLPKGRGAYEIRVVGAGGAVLHRQIHWLPGVAQPLVLRIKGEESAARSSGETISIDRLKRAPSRRAAKEYERAHHAARDGDYDKAVRHFRRAIEIHPEYIEALNDLGARLTRMGRYAEAIEALDKACELDPTGVKPRTNLAFVLLEAGQSVESERVSRRIIELAGNNEQAHYLLGLAMLRRDGSAGEAVDELLKAAPHFPLARLIAADALIGLGRAGEAQAQLRGFLQAEAEPKQ